MMNYNKEFLANMYNAYAGCNGKHYIGFQQYAKEHCKFLSAYSDLEDNWIFLSYVVLNNSVVKNIYSLNERREYPPVILLLKKLSNITDEDALLIAKAAYPKNNNYHSNLVGISIVNKLNNSRTISHFYKEIDYVSVVDMLRKLNYDIGFSGFNNDEYIVIPSLIDYGLAEDINL